MRHSPASPTQPSAENEEDLPAQLLAAVRAAAGHRSQHAPRSQRHRQRRSSAAQDPQDIIRGRMSAAGPDPRDPMELGVALDDLVATQGWTDHRNVATVLQRWEAVVGEAVAAHVGPESFDDDTGVLTVRADSPTWATNMRMYTTQVMEKIDNMVGSGVVRAIDVLGPVGQRGAARYRTRGSTKRPTRKRSQPENED